MRGGLAKSETDVRRSPFPCNRDPLTPCYSSKTSIQVVAHRLSTIKDADVIAVVKQVIVTDLVHLTDN
jgi:hypothetical protein